MLARNSVSGKVEIRIDNTPVETFDLFARQDKYGALAGPYNIAPDSTHTLTLRVTGKKRAASDGTFVNLDQIRVGAAAPPTETPVSATAEPTVIVAVPATPTLPCIINENDVCVTRTPTPTRTFTPSNTPTKTPTPLPTNTFTRTPAYTPLPTNTFTPTRTNTPLPTNTFTPTRTSTPTPTNTFTPTRTNTPLPTNTFTPTSTYTPLPTHTFTPTNTPTNTATFTPTYTDMPTTTPTFTATATETPTNTPTFIPTDTPTDTPTNIPTPPDSFTLVEQDLANSVITQDQAALYKVFALFGDSELPSQYQSETLIQDEGTAAFLYAIKDWNQLSPETQHTIADYLTPQEVSGGGPQGRQRVESPRSQPTPTPTRSVHQRNLAPGLYHMQGVITQTAKKRIRLNTERGRLVLLLSQNIPIPYRGHMLTRTDLQKGDLVDSIVRVDVKGKIRVKHLTLRERALKNPQTSSRVQTATIGSPTGYWTLPEQLSNTDTLSGAPTLAQDAQNNLGVVWDSYDTGGGIWFRFKNAATNTWSAPQQIAGTGETSSLPFLAFDATGQAHVVWEESGVEELRIAYSSGTFDAASQSWTFSAPVFISQVVGDGITYPYQPRLAATQWNNEVQLHVNWSELFAPNIQGLVQHRQVMREWRATNAQWLDAVVLDENPYWNGDAWLAADGNERVGVVYESEHCSPDTCLSVFYQECELAAANGSCDSPAAWSSTLDLSEATGLAPRLAYDSASNIHVVWQGYADDDKTLVYRLGQTDGIVTAPNPRRTTAQTTTWAPPLNLATMPHLHNLPIVSTISASDPNHVGIVWNDDADLSAPVLRYIEYDGTQWTSAAEIWNVVINAIGTNRWGNVVMDSTHLAHLAWMGPRSEVFYANNSALTPQPTLTPSSTPTATGTPTSTSTPTNTPTNTPTPTVTPNISMTEITGCVLDHQYPTAHFVIWYTLAAPCGIAGTDEVTFRAAIADGLEHGYDKYTTGTTYFNGQGLGYDLPAAPQPYQVYIVPIQAAGITLPVIGKIQAPAISLPPGVIFIDNNYLNSHSATAAHEFFHAVQWSYQQSCIWPSGSIFQIPHNWIDELGGHEDLRWWMEATAEWAQREAVTNDTSYANPIQTYLSNLQGKLSGP